MKLVSLARLVVLLSVTSGIAAAQDPVSVDGPSTRASARAVETTMHRAASPVIDLRLLPANKPRKRERPEHEDPESHPITLTAPPLLAAPAVAPTWSAPAPAPSANFDGLDFTNWGAGHPPDTNGDVGPTYFIQSINSSVGVFRKSDGVRVAAFTLDTLMSQGNFGNLCDTDNFGDPVVLYDTFEDRWVITDFAFQLDGGSNVVNPPGALQCFAVSKTGDPVSGGWNFYSIAISGGLDDYPKFGIWPDGLYMSANMFGYSAGAAFQGPRVYALNKAQMYAGNPTVQIVSFDAPSGDFTLLPGNARLQTGTPPPGTPNYFVSTWQYLNALSVYKLHVDWNSISLSTFSGPDTPLAATSWPNANVPNAPSLGGNSLDVLQIRAMVQNQYSNIGGVESLWLAHTVRRGDTTGFAAPRWYQVDVTGGTVAVNLPQAATWDPDGANVMYRFMPSVAVDRAGDMALGYSTSNSTSKPAIKYAGRLATDPVNTLSQTEQALIQGAGTQLGNCGSSSCVRWGDYSAMTLDPDGCTFWYTGEYYAVDGLAFQTRVGSFAFPSCTPTTGGATLSGTVTASVGGAPISGATVNLGSRSTVTDGSGFYTFTNLPSGTYPTLSASATGYLTASASSIVETDGNTTTHDFPLSGAPSSACPADTTQADFLTGVGTNLDLNTSPGDVLLSNATVVDQQNGTLGNSGVGITVTTWGGQTFTPAVSGPLGQVDVNLFCSGCTGTTPTLTLSLRATSGGLPIGADLATATVTGFNSGSSGYHTALFGSPANVTAGTQYAFVIRPTANPSPGTYALTRSGTSTAGSNVYAGGTRVAGATSGTVWSIPLTGGVSTDAGFKTYMSPGYKSSGDLVSSLKDANPSAGHVANWSTLAWTGTTPANTGLRFQAAASNSAAGPFNFVGPDSTAGSYFTSSAADLSQFNGNRYLRYRAYLSSTDTNATSALNDVTTCFDNVCVAPPTPTITAGGPATFCDGGSVTLTSSSATGNQWYLDGNPIAGATGQQYVATASGNYSVVVTNENGCASTASAASAITVNPTPATPSVTPGGPTMFCSGGSVTLTSSSASGNQWKLGGSPIGGETAQSYVATASGSYAVNVTANSCPSADSAATTVTVNPSPATPTITPSGPTTFYSGDSVTLTSSVASGNQWYLNGTPIGGATSQQYVATAAGAYSVTTTSSGCASAASATVVVTVIASPDLSITKTDGVSSVTPGGNTTYTIVASNAGPGTATGATVADTLPAVLTCTWTCSGAAGGTCTAAGAGNIADTVTLPSGASVTYLAACLISPTASGTLSNTATVSEPAGAVDPTPGNNSATDTDTLSALTNFSVTIDDSRQYVRVGDSLDYIVAVTNSGPSPASAAVSDTLPAGLGAASWVCTPSSGASCSNGSGTSLNDNASVPAGGTVTYVYSATLQSEVSGMLVNTASASSASDPANGDNSATDTDIVVIYRDGFEGGPGSNAFDLASAGDFSSAQVVVSQSWLDQLGIVPQVAFRGEGSAGEVFRVELLRMSHELALRLVTHDAHGMSERTPWQSVNLDGALVDFAWQAASSASVHDGYLVLRADGVDAAMLGQRWESGTLVRLRVPVDARNIPTVTLSPAVR